MTDPTLAQLWSAAHVCDPCGRAWGMPLHGAHASWEAACHLCGAVTGVSHVRHYGYLRRGLAIVDGRARHSQSTTTDTP
jgi:hypothetical protein